MKTKPKTFTLNRDLHYRGQRRKGDIVKGPILAGLLKQVPHMLDETKPPKTTNNETEVG